MLANEISSVYWGSNNKTLENPVVIDEKDRAIKEEKEKKELEIKRQEEKFKEILGN